jgi:hypothetical protein
MLRHVVVAWTSQDENQQWQLMASYGILIIPIFLSRTQRKHRYSRSSSTIRNLWSVGHHFYLHYCYIPSYFALKLSGLPGERGLGAVKQHTRGSNNRSQAPRAGCQNCQIYYCTRKEKNSSLTKNNSRVGHYEHLYQESKGTIGGCFGDIIPM